MALTKVEQKQIKYLNEQGLFNFQERMMKEIRPPYQAILPKHTDDLYEGFVYFPLNPLAGIYKMEYYNGDWMITRNNTGVGVFQEEGESLITTYEDGKVKGSSIAYLPSEHFNDDMWLDWEDFEFNVAGGFQPDDGYMWYYRGINTYIFPVMPGYPHSWYHLAVEAFEPYHTYIQELKEREGWD